MQTTYANTLKQLTTDEDGNAVNGIAYLYYPSAQTASSFTFKLSNDTIMFEAGNPQTMTDSKVMRTTSFSQEIVADDSALVVLPCPRACSDGTSDCWPKIHVRKVRIALGVEATADSTVKRASRSTVRVRNDYVQFADSSATDICPT